MKLDIHVHTSPGSRCSSMDTEAYLSAIDDMGLSCACMTNHGDMEDYKRLSRNVPPGISLIPGVEISSPRGDFLIFSNDLDFMGSLAPSQELPPRKQLPQQTAVVWAHPFAGIPGGLGPDDEHVRDVSSAVDAIEVYNANWPDPMASERSSEIAVRHDLAVVGGSDSHRVDQLMRCWTEVDCGCTSEALIEAILARETRAVIPSQY